MKKILFLLIPFLFLTGCGLQRTVSVTRRYAPTTEVTIIQSGQTLPDNIIRMGSVSVGEGGLTLTEACTYEACMAAVEEEAMKVGADIIYVVSITTPNAFEGYGYSWFTGGSYIVGGSTCFGIIADLYKRQN
ncbi:MAG: hypothetical protein ACI4BD_07295 [Paludibacteraceae bacterium]